MDSEHPEAMARIEAASLAFEKALLDIDRLDVKAEKFVAAAEFGYFCEEGPVRRWIPIDEQKLNRYLIPARLF